MQASQQFADTETFEVNLQPCEQVLGAVVGGECSQVFTSPVAGNAATSATFGNGGAVWPGVADVNGDGLWDLVACWEGGVKVFVNVGSRGNPEFAEGAVELAANADLATNGVAKLDGLSLDVGAPADALSATCGDVDQDGVEDLLVSDSEGCIWYYKSNGDGFTLQHKVWGGSHAGFAEGLRLAAVDWEDDGDLDYLAGTGNQIVSEITMGYIHVYGTNNLSEKMKYISQVGFDLTPYLKAETKGEGKLYVTLGTHSFLKVKVEDVPRTEGQVE